MSSIFICTGAIDFKKEILFTNTVQDTYLGDDFYRKLDVEHTEDCIQYCEVDDVCDAISQTLHTDGWSCRLYREEMIKEIEDQYSFSSKKIKLSGKFSLLLCFFVHKSFFFFPKQ